MKRYVLSEAENVWRGFLIDLDVQDALDLFRDAKITRCQRDPETVREAWNEFRTIVTRNETDFVRYILEHSKRDSGKKCQDCFGLFIVPDNKMTRDRLIPPLKNGPLLKGHRIPWSTVGYANLCVSLHVDGTVRLRRFQRCVHCQKHSPITDEWYTSLPEIGRAHRRSALA
jgi:hypothetical protein